MMLHMYKMCVYSKIETSWAVVENEMFNNDEQFYFHDRP